LIDPTNVFGGGTDWTAFSTLGLDFYRVVFIIEEEPYLARLQVVHNSPDPAAQVTDVYLNGDLLIDDFAFRTDAPAGSPITIDIAPATSVAVSESIYTVSPNLTNDETDITVAYGVLGTSFNLEIFVGAREAAAAAGNTDVLVHHGSPGAPTVDVVNQDGGGVLVDDISFTEFQGYLELPTNNYL
jgi:hypothetical protein